MSAVAERAKTMPIGYMTDCRAAAVVWTMDLACFRPSDFFRIRAKYRGYAPSVANAYAEIISGCCDRADSF